MGMETLSASHVLRSKHTDVERTQIPIAKEQVTQLRNGQPAYIRHFPRGQMAHGYGKGIIDIRRCKSKPENDIVSLYISVSTKKTEVLVNFCALSYTEYTYYNHYENPYEGSS